MGTIINNVTFINTVIGAGGSPAPMPSPILALDPAAYSGGTVADTSGYSNNLSVNGGSFNGALAGGAIEWSPTDFGTVASSASLSAITYSGFSIATWVRFPSVSGSQNPIIECTTSNSWGFRLDGPNSINLVKYNVADQNVSIPTISSNTWYLLVAAMGTTGTTYYINGVNVGTYNNSSAMNTPTNSSLTFARSGYYNGYSNLNLGVTKIYQDKLADSNVVTLFNTDATRYGYSPI